MITLENVYKELFNLLASDYSYEGTPAKLMQSELTWKDLNVEAKDIPMITFDLCDTFPIPAPQPPFQVTDKVKDSMARFIKGQ